MSTSRDKMEDAQRLAVSPQGVYAAGTQQSGRARRKIALPEIGLQEGSNQPGFRQAESVAEQVPPGLRSQESQEVSGQAMSSRAEQGQRLQADSQPEPQQQGHARYVKSHITRWRMFGVTAFAVIMIFGGVTGMLFFARPTTSAVEMRNLTTFPEFTVESFLDGSYFTQVSLWYADTYPLREPMVAADHAIDGLFGVNTGTGMVGGNVQADEIPVAGDEAEATGTPAVVEQPADPPDEKAVAEDIQNNIASGVYVHDGAAYNVYYFSQTAADCYVAAMNKAVERLDGSATVYSMLAPASSVMLDDDLADGVGGSDQQQTLDYLRTRFDERVRAVDLIATMKEHRGEYLYFHTDHHWTQLGAYRAYEELCRAKNVEPIALEGKRQVDLSEIRGTFYDTIAEFGAVDADEMLTYIPNGTNKLTYWNADGEQVDGEVIDESAVDWDPSYKYMGFIAGDQPLTVIDNPEVHDGSSCLVVKDSYGCAFVPNLVDSYESVHVIDFRQATDNICDYALENDIDDVIFLTNIKIGLSDTVAQTLLSEVS